ncbi:MAG: hypothetical protein AAGI23_15955 [Bacteroidota bacterium]
MLEINFKDLSEAEHQLSTLKNEELTKLCKKLIDHIKENFRSTNDSKIRQLDIAEIIGFSEGDLSKTKNKDEPLARKSEAITEMMKYFRLTIELPKKGSSVEDWKIKHDTKSNSFYDDNLRKLAGKLAINLVDVSNPFRTPKKLSAHKEILNKKYREELLSDRHRDNSLERFIVMVGKEASHIATGGYMPLQKEAIKDVMDHVTKKRKIKIPEELIEEERRRLAQIYRLDKDKFETYLLAISRFSREALTEALKKICDYDYCLSLEYEILAHIFKHRFVDVIINFNYDEILDVAIEEEVNIGEYKFIFSDGHCPSQYKKLLIDNRLRQPIYVKPNGTISYESTLRFTQEEFFAMPEELRETLNNLMSGETNNPNLQPYLPLNLIVLGHSITSFDFVNLLEDYLKNKKYLYRKVTIWTFNEQDESDELLKLLVEKGLDEKKLPKCISHNWFPTVTKKSIGIRNTTLKEYLLKLWELIEGNFEEQYRPVGISRHELLDHIFCPTEEVYKAIKTRPNEYLKGRFYVELVVALLNSDGILNTEQILEDRAGKYFMSYLEKLEEHGDTDFSIRKACRMLGLRDYKGFIKDTFTVNPPSMFHKEEDKLYGQLYHKLSTEGLLEGFGNNIRSDKTKNILIDIFEGIRSRNLLKITSDFRRPHDFMFSSIKKDNILNTSLSWTYKFNKKISRHSSWDLLLAISEKGRFLDKHIGKKSIESKKVELVLSSFDTDDDKFPDLSPEREKQLSDPNNLSLLSGHLNFLPWYLHNRHMVIFLKNKGRDKEADWSDNWDLKAGFYYQNRMLSRRANPVLVSNPVDLKILLDIFVNYWYRAKVYTRSRLEGKLKHVPIIDTKKQLRTYRKELLNLYFSENDDGLIKS